MALAQDPNAGDSLAFLQQLVVCPVCRAELAPGPATLTCTRCGREYPIHDGIPELAVDEAAAGFTIGSSAGQAYQHKYTDDVASADYDRQFVENRRKHARTERELEILRRLLARGGEIDSLLNIPCGGGRLSEPLARNCARLVEADVALAQASYARDHGANRAASSTGFITASAFHPPFKDASFDGVVCVRLIHHFSAREDHERLVGELCRVAARFVILSYNDVVSVKALSRRLRGKANPMTLSVTDVRRLAHLHGYQVDEILSVSPLGSRHRFALLVRDGALRDGPSLRDEAPSPRSEAPLLRNG